MSCRPCPAASAGLDQATKLWPARSRISDGICGDAAHAARQSDHNPDSRGIAHAFDLTHDPAHGCDAHAQADAARIRALRGEEPRLKYVISKRRIASPSTRWNWAAYDGSNPHDKHAHFSILTAHENDTRPWYPAAGEDDDMFSKEAQEFLQEELKNLERRLRAELRKDLMGSNTEPKGVMAALQRNRRKIEAIGEKVGADNPD